MHDVLVLILGGGRGARLFPLTKHRSEPAVPIAGKYRLIDIPISNCINSDLRRVYVLTQYMSVSLHRHIANTYKLSPFSRGFVEVLAAQQTNENADWYEGTADAVRQNLRYVETEGGRDVLVLYGDQLYRMNYQKMLAAHRESGADVTLAVKPVNGNDAGRYGIIKANDDNRITDFVEKPTGEELKNLRTPSPWLTRHGLPANRGEYLANMGVYFYRRKSLLDLLGRFPDAADLVLDVLTKSLTNHRIHVFPFDGYWQDVGSIKAYYEANLALTADEPPFDFHGPQGVIYTRMRYLPASQVIDAHVEKCLVSDGCIISEGTELTNSVMGVRSCIGKDVHMRGVIMMGANYYDTGAPRSESPEVDRPSLGVGAGSVLERVILDKNCRIGQNVRITNDKRVQHVDRDNYYIRDGIVVVPNSGVIPDRTVI